MAVRGCMVEPNEVLLSIKVLGYVIVYATSSREENITQLASCPEYCVHSRYCITSLEPHLFVRGSLKGFEPESHSWSTESI